MASSESQKADQIAFHFYTKLFYVVNHARTTNPLPAKLDKWVYSDLFTKDERELYKSISTSPPPTLEIQVLLTIPELTHNQVLVHLSPDSSRVRIHPTPRFILLETFLLDFIPGPPVDVPLPTIYKHGIPLFRSLFTLLRVLPAWKLHKRLRRRPASLGITLRVRTGHDPDVLSLSNAESKSYTFPPLPHPMGTLALSTTYLSSPTFQLDELESLLSSRFLSLDQRPFTPTLAKNTAASSSSSPPRSPPRQPSSLPRSSLARQSITAATLGTPPPTRAQALRQLDSSNSSLSPSNSFYTPAAGQDIQTRPRYPFPFKSNTVSSTTFPSSSLGSASGHPSSLSDRLAQYDRERVASLPHTQDLSGSQSQRTGPVPLHVRQVSLSRPTSLKESHEIPDDPSASTSASTSASGTRKRYSSSFGYRYNPPSPSPSTSFPAHRPLPGLHSPSSPSLSPSSPSHVRPPVHSPSSPLFPIPRSTGRSSIGTQVRTDDEDISLFVQDIDARKPLVGRARTPVDSGAERDSESMDPPRRSAATAAISGFDNVPFASSSPQPEATVPQQVLPQSPPGGLMLTSEAEVDARLRRMNETFLLSLQGLGSGGGSTRQRSQSQAGGRGSRFSGARDRERERERERDSDMDMGRRERSGTGTWIGQPPGMLVRQGSQEVVGRMDIYSGVDVDDLDPHEDHHLGVERGSGGRYIF
ncbi:hypothetical protein C0991_003680 [Blastosporella zonata]|nr:hypothetical protein C0991_003680 [Blastosporella zonata]